MGCRGAGLPPEPPEHDASDPEVGIVEVRPQPSPLMRSAFEGVPLDGASGHEHHHHGAKAEEVASPEPAGPKASEHESHESHGSHGGRS